MLRRERRLISEDKNNQFRMAKTVVKTKKVDLSLPPDVDQALSSKFGNALNVQIAQEFGLNAGQLLSLTMLIRDFYVKAIPVATLESEVVKRLRVPKEKVNAFAQAVCSKRLLIINKWLNGEPAKKLTELGGNPSKFEGFVDEYIEALAREEVDEEEALTAQQALENPEPIRELEEEKAQTIADVMQDPEAEKKASLEVFANNIKDLLESTDLPMRREVNIRLVYLLADDAETKFFQKELLEELYNNKEAITTDKIILKNEKVDATIGNWPNDYVQFVGVEGIVNSLKKAQYQADSDNMKKLPPAERALIDKLFNLYSAVKNFYANMEKMKMDDIEIFPFTDAERLALVKQTTDRQAAAEESVATAEAPEAAVDIAALYQGKPADRAAIDKVKADIAILTRGEFNKVADELEKQLLARQKFAIIAGIELLAENGALDDVLANDQRYRSYLAGYFKRNNLAAEAAEFARDPHNAKFLKHFLRFVFLERLGMAESEGARLAANLSNIFLANGLFEYGELAYLDLNDRTFKWD